MPHLTSRYSVTMVTTEELEQRVTNVETSYRNDMALLRTELNGMNKAIILAQSIAADSGKKHEEHRDPEMSEAKLMSMKIKDYYSLVPQSWGGEKDSPFTTMAHDVVTYMKMVHPDAETIMDFVARSEEKGSMEDIDEEMFPCRSAIDEHLYATLCRATKDAAKTFVRNAQRSGLEAWRKLHKQYDSNTSMDESMSLQRILSPVKGKDPESVKLAIERFENDVRDHNAKFKDEINEGVKILGLRTLIPDSWAES